MQGRAMKRRGRRILTAVLLVILVIAGIAADSSLRLVTTEYELRFSALPSSFDGFRVLQISDLHGAVFGKGNARLLRAAAAAGPDLIAVTGDLADGRTDLGEIETLLTALTELAPVYYVSGNHEWSAGILDALEQVFRRSGVRWLRNEYLPLERDGGAIVLAGVEDPNGWKDMERPDTFTARLRAGYPEEFTLLLAHRNDWPDKYPELPVDLILCGHGHGGIIRLPFLGGVLGSGYTLFPDWTAGVYDCGSYRMVVSRGLGSGVRIPRFLNNPELVCVTLRCA